MKKIIELKEWNFKTDELNLKNGNLASYMEC